MYCTVLYTACTLLHIYAHGSCVWDALPSWVAVVELFNVALLRAVLSHPSSSPHDPFYLSYLPIYACVLCLCVYLYVCMYLCVYIDR